MVVFVKLEFKNTVLLVEDVEKSKKFYVELLGQEISEDFGRYIGFKAGFGIWLAEFAHNLIFNQSIESITSTRKQVELYFETEDINSTYRQLKDQNVEFIHPIEQQQWWQNVLRCYDPDHHIVEIGEPYRVDFESEEKTISY